MGSFFSLGKSSNDTQENPKDAQKSTNFHEKCTKPTETTELTNENTKLKTEKTELNSKITGLSAEKDKLDKEKTELTEKNKNLTTEKERLERESKNLTTEKENLNNQLNASQKQVNELKNSKQVLENEKAELERRHAPYQKLEKLYEVFLEVKDRLNFNFVATTHSAMDLIASVLSDSKYYLENLYNQASQELGDKRSDKGEKLAELFDLLFEYVKDSKFERLKEPSAYDYSCKTLYPEQNTSQKMQRVVLRGYKHNDKVYHTIVDMGS
ncbi:M protein [Helicobacter pylori]